MIKGNQFIECGYNQTPNNYVISISSENHEEVPGYFVHENIIIEDNVFKLFDTPILKAKSTKGLKFINNEMVSSDLFSDLKGGKPSFDLQQCTEVTLELNASDSKRFDTIKTNKMTKNDLTIMSSNPNRN